MKSLVLLEIWLMSRKEKSGAHFHFSPHLNAVVGENKSGKSALLKSIYRAFGADPERKSGEWEDIAPLYLVKFSIDEHVFFLLRSGNFFGLFDGEEKRIFSASGVSEGIGPKIADLLDFNLVLPDHNGGSKRATPALCFLPFYVDQDIGWQSSWSSFAGIGQFKEVRKGTALYHSGIRPKEYYGLRADVVAIEVEKREKKVEHSGLERAFESIRKNRRTIKVDLKPQRYHTRISALLAEMGALQDGRYSVQKDLSVLQNDKALLSEQIAIAGAVLAELEQDVKFMTEEVTEEAVVCPTCGAAHENSFANRFSVISDLYACREYLARKRVEEKEIALSMNNKQLRIDKFSFRVNKINEILDEKQGKVTLRDVIEGESERQIDEVMLGQLSEIERHIGRLDGKLDDVKGALKKYESVALSKKINSYFSLKMEEFLSALSVDGIRPADYRRVDTKMHGTGSEYARALLAYYFAYIWTIKTYGTSFFNAFVVDTPFQQDPDADNRRRIISFVQRASPPNAQVIFATTSLSDVPFHGNIIRVSGRKIMKKDNYETVQKIFSGFMEKMI